MSIFTDRRSVAHPEWLPQFFKDFDSQTALIKNGTLPEGGKALVCLFALYWSSLLLLFLSGFEWTWGWWL